jgi:hypothetical protein
MKRWKETLKKKCEDRGIIFDDTYDGEDELFSNHIRLN